MEINKELRLKILFWASLILISSNIILYLSFYFISDSINNSANNSSKFIYNLKYKLWPLMIFGGYIWVGNLILFIFSCPIINSFVNWKNSFYKYTSFIIIFALMMATWSIGSFVFILIAKIKNKKSLHQKYKLKVSVN